jgi:hypothetical protein
LDLRLNADLRQALHDQAVALSGGSTMPPDVQWLRSTRVVDPLANLLLWGVPAAGALGLAGVGLAGRDLLGRERRSRAGTPAAAIAGTLVLAVLGWFSWRYAHPLRYLLPAVPALCALAAFTLARLHRRHARLTVAATAATLLIGTAWALAFTSIYRRPHTHVAAAAWIRAHVPAGARIAFESWDEGLPVDATRYRTTTAPVFGPDDATKAGQLYASVMRSDYYVIVSPRAWWTVGRLPRRYPLMTAFYRELLAGDLGFERVATFRSDPGLLGVTIRDTAAEEAQWVYDHPPVLVFRRVTPLSRQAFAARLGPPA